MHVAARVVIFGVKQMLLFVFLLVSFSFINASLQQGSYYGRAFGVASNWTQVDHRSSHHLEVYFKPMPNMPYFQANIDIQSRDGSSLYVAFVQGSGLSAILPLIQGQGKKCFRKVIIFCVYDQ